MSDTKTPREVVEEAYELVERAQKLIEGLTLDVPERPVAIDGMTRALNGLQELAIASHEPGWLERAAFNVEAAPR